MVERRVEARVEVDRLSEVALGDVGALLGEVCAADEVVHLGRRAERERPFEMHEGLREPPLDGVQAPKSVVRDEGVLPERERSLEVLARRVHLAVVAAQDAEHQRRDGVVGRRRAHLFGVVARERAPPAEEEMLAEKETERCVLGVDQQRLLEPAHAAARLSVEQQLHAFGDQPFERDDVRPGERVEDLSRSLLEALALVEFLRVAIDQLLPLELDLSGRHPASLFEHADDCVEQGMVVKGRRRLPVDEVEQPVVVQAEPANLGLERADALEQVLLDAFGLLVAHRKAPDRADDEQRRPALRAVRPFDRVEGRAPLAVDRGHVTCRRRRTRGPTCARASPRRRTS